MAQDRNGTRCARRALIRRGHPRHWRRRGSLDVTHGPRLPGGGGPRAGCLLCPRPPIISGGKEDLLGSHQGASSPGGAELGARTPIARPAPVGRARVPRVSAIVATNFSPSQFRTETIAAWLAFYVEAQRVRRQCAGCCGSMRAGFIPT